MHSRLLSCNKYALAGGEKNENGIKRGSEAQHGECSSQ